MTEYLEIKLELLSRQESEHEIILALLADFGFEGFREEEGRIFAYVGKDIFKPGDFDRFFEQYSHLVKSFTTNQIPHKNWNEEWEKSYSPVKISDNCVVRAPFHSPPKGIKYDLVISPKMSFGTAHHETTRLMILELLEGKWEKNKLLDLGCGTGVLAVLASRMGAENVIALDNDPGACKNAQENVALNNCSNVRIACGELKSLQKSGFNTILANINLNVLLMEMGEISSRLKFEGVAIMSGFYQKDLQQLNEAAHMSGMVLVGKRSLNHWTVAVYRKGD